MTPPALDLAGIPIPHYLAVHAECGWTLIETATGLPVSRWRTERIVPAPGAARTGAGQ